MRNDMWQVCAHCFQSVWRWVRTHPWLAFALLGIGIGIQVFAEIAENEVEGSLLMVDQAILAAIHLMQTPTLILIAILFSDLLLLPYILILVVPITLYLLRIRRGEVALLILLIITLTNLMVGVLKSIFERPRPLANLILEVGYSFPSGHATSSVVVYGLLGYVAWRYWTRKTWARILIVLVTLSLILATGVSRVILGVHYPSDVFAGWAAGSAILLGSIIILETWFNPERGRVRAEP